MTFGFSRDDIEGRLMSPYLEQGLLKRNPFETIDAAGVGELVKMAAERGRAAKPDLKLGVCGEHGGDPESIALFREAGLDYVSCSPFRVPIARLAAAQAILGGAYGAGDVRANRLTFDVATGDVVAGASVASRRADRVRSSAQAAVEGALAAGRRRYADARAMVIGTEGLAARRTGVLERPGARQRVGRRGGAGPDRLVVGVLRHARPVRRPRPARPGTRRPAIAKASAMVPGPPLELADVARRPGPLGLGVAGAPVEVSLSEKGDLLVDVTATMQTVDGRVGGRRPTSTPGTPRSGSCPARATASPSTSWSAARP